MWILLSVSEAWGAAPRTLWLFQQLGRFSPANSTDGLVTVEGDFDQIEDTLSVAGRAGIMVGPVEIRAKASQRLFLDLTDAGKRRHTLGGAEATALCVEVGRQFVSSRGHYGRLGLELTHFLPSGANFWGLLIHTGTAETPESPWNLRLSAQVRFGFSGTESNLILDSATERVIWAGGMSRLRLGGAISWAQRLKDGPGNVPTEHAVLTLGPVGSWENPLGEFKLRLGFRLWLDRDTSVTSVAYLSEFDLPALTASWSYRF